MQFLPSAFGVCPHHQTSIQIGIAWNTGIICARISLSQVLHVGYKCMSGLFGKLVKCRSGLASSFSHQVTPKFSETSMYFALLLELILAQSNGMGQSVSWGSEKYEAPVSHRYTLRLDPQKTVLLYHSLLYSYSICLQRWLWNNVDASIEPSVKSNW